MHNILKAIRYVVFGTFIICNAIIASLSVWNFSISQAIGRGLRADTYLTVVGASGLAFIFIIIFLELARKSAITGRVWFECTWVGIYWILELAGAAALSALGPMLMCTEKPGSANIFISNGCASTQAMLAFSWICTIALMFYLILLIIVSLIQYKRDARIWQCEVQNFPWADTRCILSSSPPSPSLPRFEKTAPSIVAPRPRRAAPAALYSYRSGLSPEYEIEHYRPPSTFAQPAPPEPAAFPVHRQAQERPAPSFYPQYMQASLAPTQAVSAQRQDNIPSPPPLGVWPRPNIISQPTTRSNRARPPQSVTAGQAPAAGTSPTPSSQPRSRPAGPRRRSESSEDNRPSRLDLSNISSFKPPALK